MWREKNAINFPTTMIGACLPISIVDPHESAEPKGGHFLFGATLSII
jgi:hypothetical protein